MQNPRHACKLSSLVQCDGAVQILHHCAARSYSVDIYACAIAHDYVIRSMTMHVPDQQFCELESQEALLIVYCDQ